MLENSDPEPNLALGAIEPERERAGWRTWVWRIYDLFALLMIAFLVVSQFVGNAIWPITVLAYVTIFIVPIAFVLLPLALFRGRRLGPALQIICAIAFLLVLVDTRAEHRVAEPPPGASVVTVMTFNLGNGMASPDELVPMLQESGADVVGLVEVTAATASAIESDLAGQYPYRVVMGDGIEGKGLLSRFPIVEYEWLNYNPGRPDLRVQLEIDLQLVTVVVAHPPPPEITWRGVQDRSGTRAQIDGIFALIAEIDHPLLLIGDFNITRQHDLYDEIEATGLQDTFHISGQGFGFTMPARFQHLAAISDRLADIRIHPVARIDYIWASPEWLPLDARVGKDAGSDHLPVIAALALRPAS
jgi:endonuclease/exonuclease/phosphatase (EEP) superfamily protein YafD